MTQELTGQWGEMAVGRYGESCGGMWRSGNSPVTNTGMDPAGDKNVGSSPGLGSLACGTFSKGWSSGVFSGYSGFLSLFKIVMDADHKNYFKYKKILISVS